MGFFTPKVPVELRGVVDRIGIARINDTVITYMFTLVGRTERYHVSLHQEARKTVHRAHVALAEKGDAVRVVVSDKYPTDVDAFENLDLT